MLTTCAVFNLQLMPIENLAGKTAATRGLAHTFHEAASKRRPVAGDLVRLNRFAQVSWDILVSVNLNAPRDYNVVRSPDSPRILSELCAPLPPHVRRHPKFDRTHVSTSEF